MTAHMLHFVELLNVDRKAPGRIQKLAKGDQIELHIKRHGGVDQTLSLPPDAASLIEAPLGHLSQGQRVAVLTEDQELSPNDAASILGISRPLVVHRMNAGDLPFRYVGKHRRSKLRDVLALKAKIDAQRTAMQALADDAVDLNHRRLLAKTSAATKISAVPKICVDQSAIGIGIAARSQYTRGCPGSTKIPHRTTTPMAVQISATRTIATTQMAFRQSAQFTASPLSSGRRRSSRCASNHKGPLSP